MILFTLDISELIFGLSAGERNDWSVIFQINFVDLQRRLFENFVPVVLLILKTFVVKTFGGELK